MSRTGPTLQRAETINGVLVPALTPWDLKILRAVPASVPIATLLNERGQHGITVWRVAENAREMDLTAVLMTLRGLYRRDLVRALGRETQRRWIRTDEGDRKAA